MSFSTWQGWVSSIVNKNEYTNDFIEEKEEEKRKLIILWYHLSNLPENQRKRKRMFSSNCLLFWQNGKTNWPSLRVLLSS